MKGVYFAALLFSLGGYSAFCQNINNISSLLKGFEKDQNFSGVVIIKKGKEVLLHQGYGFLDQEQTIRTDKNTVYNIASIAKSFTAIAVLNLVEQGKLSLTDTVGKFFDHLPADKAVINIHQLLIHHSGIPQTYAADGETNFYCFVNLY